MKSIQDVEPKQFIPLVEALLKMGWQQPKTGYADSYVLQQPRKGHTAHVFTFPTPYLAIVNKADTEVLAAVETLQELLKLNLKP